MKHVLKFIPEKETPNKQRFQEVAEPGKPKVVGVLYIEKWTMPKTGVPKELKVTIEG